MSLPYEMIIEVCKYLPVYKSMELGIFSDNDITNFIKFKFNIKKTVKSYDEMLYIVLKRYDVCEKEKVDVCRFIFWRTRMLRTRQVSRSNIRKLLKYDFLHDLLIKHLDIPYTCLNMLLKSESLKQLVYKGVFKVHRGLLLYEECSIPEEYLKNDYRLFENLIKYQIETGRLCSNYVFLEFMIQNCQREKYMGEDLVALSRKLTLQEGFEMVDRYAYNSKIFSVFNYGRYNIDLKYEKKYIIDVLKSVFNIKVNNKTDEIYHRVYEEGVFIELNQRRAYIKKGCKINGIKNGDTVRNPNCIEEELYSFVVLDKYDEEIYYSYGKKKGSWGVLKIDTE